MQTFLILLLILFILLTQMSIHCRGKNWKQI